jgi:hypothetical protein
MKLRLRDTISYQGKDFLVEGLLAYRIGGKAHSLARVVDGQAVRWIEPLTGDLDDRILLFDETRDLDIATPPPATISYRGKSYVPRLSGPATVEISGTVPERTSGTCEMWRYRAAGDLFLQIEKWPDRVIVLAGESVHKDMIEVLPGS